MIGKIYFTLTGTKHYFGKEFLKSNMDIILVTEGGVLCKLNKKSVLTL